MKKFLISLLCVMMVFCMMPGMAFAGEGYVAKIGETTYSTFAEAMTAANAMTGDVTVDIYGAVEFVNGMELKGSYASITFNGEVDDAKITINQTAGGDYLEAHGKTVAFNDLILAKANPAWSGNSAHMGNYFSIQGGTVTYTGCTFSNGACTSGGTATYNSCTFQNTSEYGLWVYDDALVTVNGGTIDSKKGIKVYSEGEDSVTSTLTVEGATFTANVTEKPAVAIGYAESITLIGNTYNNTKGVLELDSGSDADCEGIDFVAKDAEGNDIASTLTAVDRSNSNAACGVLVDGKIYTTVTEAAADVTAGDTVTLLYASAESVELPVGTTLNKNGYTADNVSVKEPTTHTASTPEELANAFSTALEGDIITLLSDVTPVLTSQRAITKASVIDLGGNTLTLTEDDLYFGTTTFKNGTIIVDPSVRPSTAVFWMFANQTLTFDNVKVVATGVTGTYLIGLDGNNSDLNLINGSEIVVSNDTALDLDIICVNASTGNDIVIDNSKVTVSNLDGRVFFRGNYTVSGNSVVDMENITKAGIRIEAGQTLSVEDTASVTITGESRDGGIHLTDVTSVFIKEETATVSATVNTPLEAALPEAPTGKIWVDENGDGIYELKDDPNYVPPTPPTPTYTPSVTIQKPVITTDAGAAAELNILGTTATITVAEGYELVDVTVNGVSKGAVTSLSGLKTGDTVVVTTKLIEAPKTEAQLVQEKLDGMALVARSKRTAAPSGKDSIMVYWYDKAGAEFDFDGVEIYRSTKKGSGYKKVFTSKTDKYYNTAIEEGVKYYYKVRGYVTVDGEKLYTDWSLKAIRTAK